MKKSQISLKEFKALLPYLARYRTQYIVGIICLIIVDAAQIAIPQFLRVAIDMISSGGFELKQIIILALWMIGIMALVSSGRFLWRFFIHGSSRRIEAQLREDLFSHLTKLSWDFYQKNKIGDLMARSINDLHAVRMSIGMGLVALFDFVFMAGAILIIIFIQDANSALYSIIPLPLVTALILIFGSMVGKKFRTAQEAYSKMSERTQETFAGINVVKSFVKEWWFIKKFADSNDDYKEANMALVRLFGFFFPFISLISGLTILIMIAIGGVRVINGDMTPGSLVAMFRYLSMLIWPLLGAGFMVNMIQRGAVSLGRINEIMNTEPSIKNEELGIKNEDFNVRLDNLSNSNNSHSSFLTSHYPAIEIIDMSFSYEEKNVLEKINLTINRGQWLGVMGKTGAGKSTLIKTFMRLLDPPPGSVRVFGLDVRDWPLEELRRLFAVSPQDSYLFSDTIAKNIIYGMTEDNTSFSEDSRNNLIKAIELASLGKDLDNFQLGKDTLVGERGLTLSGGQKQRTAVARAFIMDSEFLVLDDSFSAVDNETEVKILNALWNERKGRTTIIISHRVSTLKYADNILVLDKGKILEYGSPSQLIGAGGFYSRMAAFQSLESSDFKNGLERANG
ncbi:MAG: ABC transporter ATP-binding protein/permease [Treponema sp.]|jgi:ATP-binding cassette subfamily B protein|nr:ABC transporter ATP-binding protein/permease [Treponema sp.]